MNVEMISKTVGCGKLSSLKTSDIISFTARVSNPDNQLNFDSSEKLIRYLLKKSHWSPFSMVDVTFEIKTTRDIGRQILRHKSFDFQEFSQRYAEVPTEDLEWREARYQDQKNRQSSYTDSSNFEGNSNWFLIQKSVRDIISKFYKEAINLNIAKEQARSILPEGLTPSTMYMKGSVRSWFHFCLVRCHPGTQKEHREIANIVWSQLQEEFEFFKNLDMQKLSIKYQEMFETSLKDCYNVI